MRNQGLEVAIKPPTRRYTEFAPHSCEHQLGLYTRSELERTNGQSRKLRYVYFSPADACACVSDVMHQCNM